MNIQINTGVCSGKLGEWFPEGVVYCGKAQTKQVSVTTITGLI